MSAENVEDTIMEDETEMPLEEIDEENKLFLVRILTTGDTKPHHIRVTNDVIPLIVARIYANRSLL